MSRCLVSPKPSFEPRHGDKSVPGSQATCVTSQSPLRHRTFTTPYPSCPYSEPVGRSQARRRQVMRRTQVSDLYWLGYLLTGDHERTAEILIEDLETIDA